MVITSGLDGYANSRCLRCATLSRYSRVLFNSDVEIQSLFRRRSPTETTEHSRPLLLYGGVIIRLCSGHGYISKGLIGLVE